MGQHLAIQWYESKLDAEASAAVEANALLSDGRCNLVAGYPLVKDALGKPGVETARLPGFTGAQPADRRRRVELGTLMPTKPYHFAGLTVVLGEKAKGRRVAGLADLEGLNLTVEVGTLGDAVLMSFDHGRFVSKIAHVAPGRDQLFVSLEGGEADATLIPVHRFDAYRIAHPDSGCAVRLLSSDRLQYGICRAGECAVRPCAPLRCDGGHNFLLFRARAAVVRPPQSSRRANWKHRGGKVLRLLSQNTVQGQVDCKGRRSLNMR